jgi:hypothetical protein
MRAINLISYICGETIDKYSRSIEYKLYTQNKLIYTIYRFNYPCSICKIDCHSIICYLSKYSSKITCDKFVYYRYYCYNKKIYTIQLDDKMIKE